MRAYPEIDLKLLTYLLFASRSICETRPPYVSIASESIFYPRLGDQFFPNIFLDQSGKVSSRSRPRHSSLKSSESERVWCTSTHTREEGVHLSKCSSRCCYKKREAAGSRERQGKKKQEEARNDKESNRPKYYAKCENVVTQRPTV